MALVGQHLQVIVEAQGPRRGFGWQFQGLEGRGIHVDQRLVLEMFAEGVRHGVLEGEDGGDGRGDGRGDGGGDVDGSCVMEISQKCSRQNAQWD